MIRMCREFPLTNFMLVIARCENTCPDEYLRWRNGFAFIFIPPNRLHFIMLSNPKYVYIA